MLSVTKTKQYERLDIELSDLSQAFSTIPDPRRAQGRVYWLVSVQIWGAAGFERRKKHSMKGLRPLARQVPKREASLMRVVEPLGD